MQISNQKERIFELIWWKIRFFSPQISQSTSRVRNKPLGANWTIVPKAALLVINNAFQFWSNIRLEPEVFFLGKILITLIWLNNKTETARGGLWISLLIFAYSKYVDHSISL